VLPCLNNGAGSLVPAGRRSYDAGMRRMILLPLLLLWVGCGKPAEPPKTVAQLRDVAVAARDEAKSAQEPQAADLAAATQFGKRLLLHVPGIGGEKP